MSPVSLPLKALLEHVPQTGRIEWIGVRGNRRGEPATPYRVALTPNAGLAGDHYAGRSGKRQVTLMQAEHVPVIAALVGAAHLDYALFRRNVMVSGINLLALSRQRFTLGDVLLEATGLCHPCSRMEEALGPGGYNAMRGHGGITARVLSAGEIGLDDPVRLAARDAA